MTLLYDPTVPRCVQKDSWSCLTQSLKWTLASLGLELPDRSLERQMIAFNITNRSGYLTDKTGHDITGFTEGQFQYLGITARYTPSASFDEVTAVAGRCPVIIGGSIFLHYTAVRAYEPARDVLVLANSADGWQSIHQTMSRAEFDRRRPMSMILVAPPQLIEEGRDHGRPGRLGGLRRSVIAGGTTLYVPAARDIERFGGRSESPPVFSRS